MDNLPPGPTIRTPSPLSILRELKVVFELIGLFTLKAYIKENSPIGDGHTVIVIPGFGHSNAATNTLRKFLNGLGYNALPWIVDQNMGLSRESVEAVTGQVRREQARDGNPVSLVGWSLGGMYARIVAHDATSSIRQVITLASPFKATDIEQPGRLARALVGSAKPLNDSELNEFMHKFNPAPPVPSTSIFSRGDHIVDIECSMDIADEKTENIRTWGSHSGMVLNPFVYAILANRLSEQIDSWSPLAPAGMLANFAFPMNQQERCE